MKSLMPIAVLGLVCGSAFADNGKAYLTIVAEKKIIADKTVPHSMAFLEYPDGTSKWLGFVPKEAKTPIGEGKIDTSAPDRGLDKWVRLEVDAKRLADAEKKTREKYASIKYEVTVCDCVSFTADLCEAAGLKIPVRPNFVPANLPDRLKELNPAAHPVVGTGKLGASSGK